MKMARREILKATAGIGTGGLLVGQNVYASPFKQTSKRVIVGPGGDYDSIAEALGDITDNSPTRRYQILVLPGTYGGFATKEHIDIVGSGVKSTLIQTSFDDYIQLGSNVMVANFGIRYSGTDGGGTERGAIQEQSGSQTEIILRDLEIEVSGIQGIGTPRYAINFTGSSGVRLTAYNVRIRTDSCGLHLWQGQSRWHGCDIYLTGNTVGTPHIGVTIASGNRFDWYGGRIGTGYYYDANLNDPDQDVIGILIPETNVSENTRAQVHDAEMFARNVNALPGVKVNAVRAENGWARLFGCYCQTELTPDANNNGSRSVYGAFRTPAEPADGFGGRVEAYGCRIRSMEGYVIGGAGAQGMFNYATANDGAQIQRYENMALCDAAAGPFTLKLSGSLPPTVGDEHVFKKIDSSANVVTISGNGNLIDGLTSVQLTSQYDSVKVRRAEDQWYIV